MLRGVQKPVLLTLAIVLALLPLVELVDHWESYGSDPEFVSVCTVLGVAFGIPTNVSSLPAPPRVKAIFAQPIGRSHVYIARCHSSGFRPHTSSHSDLDTSCLG